MGNGTCIKHHLATMPLLIERGSESLLRAMKQVWATILVYHVLLRGVTGEPWNYTCRYYKIISSVYKHFIVLYKSMKNAI